MTWVSAAVVFVISWWIALFCILPLGIRPANEGHLGHDPGAPANPRLWRRMGGATLVALLVTAAAYGIAQTGWINLRGEG